MVEHIDRELNRLRELAHKLKLNGANNINWNCLASSGSDGASTQKRSSRGGSTLWLIPSPHKPVGMRSPFYAAPSVVKPEVRIH